MWSPWSANVTAPGSSRRTMSVESRAGITQLPSSIPMTSSVTWIVRSRSVPVTRKLLPSHCNKRPWRTGEEPPRPPTARPAVASISTSASRSDLNFTDVGPFGRAPGASSWRKEYVWLVKVVRAVDCGGHGCMPSLAPGPAVPMGVCVSSGDTEARRPGLGVDGENMCPRPQTQGRSPQPFPLVIHKGRRAGRSEGQAEPARIFWLSSVTCS